MPTAVAPTTAISRARVRRSASLTPLPRPGRHDVRDAVRRLVGQQRHHASDHACRCCPGGTGQHLPCGLARPPRTRPRLRRRRAAPRRDRRQPSACVDPPLPDRRHPRPGTRAPSPSAPPTRLPWQHDGDPVGGRAAQRCPSAAASAAGHRLRHDLGATAPAGRRLCPSSQPPTVSDSGRVGARSQAAHRAAPTSTGTPKPARNPRDPGRRWRARCPLRPPRPDRASLTAPDRAPPRTPLGADRARRRLRPRPRGRAAADAGAPPRRRAVSAPCRASTDCREPQGNGPDSVEPPAAEMHQARKTNQTAVAPRRRRPPCVAGPGWARQQPGGAGRHTSPRP